MKKIVLVILTFTFAVSAFAAEKKVKHQPSSVKSKVSIECALGDGEDNFRITLKPSDDSWPLQEAVAFAFSSKH